MGGKKIGSWGKIQSSQNVGNNGGVPGECKNRLAATSEPPGAVSARVRLNVLVVWDS